MAILGPLQFCMNFGVSLSISTKTATGILIGIALSLLVKWGNIAILTILSLPILKRGISSYLFRSFKISFNNVL